MLIGTERGEKNYTKVQDLSEQILINGYDIFDVQTTRVFVYRIIITVRLPRS